MPHTYFEIIMSKNQQQLKSDLSKHLEKIKPDLKKRFQKRIEESKRPSNFDFLSQSVADKIAQQAQKFFQSKEVFVYQGIEGGWFYQSSISEVRGVFSYLDGYLEAEKKYFLKNLDYDLDKLCSDEDPKQKCFEYLQRMSPQLENKCRSDFAEKYVFVTNEDIEDVISQAIISVVVYLSSADIHVFQGKNKGWWYTSKNEGKAALSVLTAGSLRTQQDIFLNEKLKNPNVDYTAAKNIQINYDFDLAEFGWKAILGETSIAESLKILIEKNNVKFTQQEFEIIVLRSQGFTLSELAKHYDMTKEAVRMTEGRGYRKLRKIDEENFDRILFGNIPLGSPNNFSKNQFVQSRKTGRKLAL